MKHTFNVTLVLVGVFLLAQVVGLAITNSYVDSAKTEETGVISFKELPLNVQRPDIDESQSYIFIMGALLIGTALVLLLIKLRGLNIWRFWFFLAASLCLTIAFGAFIHPVAALLLAVALAIFKVYRPNFYVHNFTEVFIYGGLAAIFVPIMNFFAIVIVLLVISVYDMIAVWQSKHMIKMAEFQSESNVFAGINVPYSFQDMKKITLSTPKKRAKSGKKTEYKMRARTAILGGGDIGFPLLFAGVLMKSYGFWKVLVVPVVVAVALFLLLYYAKKDKFYPAMPFLTAGCFVGYFMLLLM
ncbi:MAG: presenilin family intramembrane aspartyl protease [Candidatus Nanoarchaeia archaeon]